MAHGFALFENTHDTYGLSLVVERNKSGGGGSGGGRFGSGGSGGSGSSGSGGGGGGSGGGGGGGSREDAGNNDSGGSSGDGDAGRVDGGEGRAARSVSRRSADRERLGPFYLHRVDSPVHEQFPATLWAALNSVSNPPQPPQPPERGRGREGEGGKVPGMDREGANGERAFAAGDPIEARFGGGDDWFGGRVSKVNGMGGCRSFDIDYDDGDEEKGVAAEYVRVRGTGEGGGQGVDAEDVEMLLAVLVERLIPFTATKERDQRCAQGQGGQGGEHRQEGHGQSLKSSSEMDSTDLDSTDLDPCNNNPQYTSIACYRDGQRVVLEMAVQTLRGMIGMVT